MPRPALRPSFAIHPARSMAAGGRAVGGGRLHAVLALAAAALLAPAGAAQAPCAAETGEYAQITLQSLDAGIQVFEAFRIAPSGQVEWASWNNDRRLIGHVPPRLPGRNVYAQARALAATGVAGSPGEGKAFAVSVAAVTSRGRTFASYDVLPEGLAPTLSYLRGALKPLGVPRGPHLWLWPHPGGGAVDVELGPQACSAGSIAKSVAGALSSGRMLVPLSPEAAKAFVSQAPLRWAFGARSEGRYTMFGVVSAD